MVLLLNALLMVVILLNIFLLGSSRLAATIRAAAWQGVLLACMPLVLHEATLGVLLLSLSTMVLKGVMIPQMLLHAMREVHIRREAQPVVGFLPSMLLGAVATGLAIAFASRLPLVAAHANHLVVPAALATVVVGFLLITTRVEAISQVVGYLVLESGVFIFGLLLFQAMPFLVEVGVLLDLLVGVFVTSIIIHRIHRAFESLDTRRLTTLKE